MKKLIFLTILLTSVTITSCFKQEEVLIIIRGDSIAAGIGSSGTNNSVEYYKGKQIQGDSTWGKQLQAMLDRRSDYRYHVDILGFPGQNSKGFLKDQLSMLINDLKKSSKKYKYVVYCSEFGTNDSKEVGVNDSSSVDTLILNISAISKAVRSVPGLNNKLFIIGYPLTRRVDKYAQANTNLFRNEYNSRIIKNPSLIGADLTMDFRKYSGLYNDHAPLGKNFAQNDVDKLSGVHQSNSGYNLLATMTLETILQIVN